MGNAPSKSPGDCSEEVLATLSPKNQKKLNQLAYPNFFEVALIASETPMKKRSASASQASIHSNTPSKKEKRKWSSSSEESNISSILTPATPPATESNSSIRGINPFCNTTINFEMINGRRYQSSPGTHFYLPCDDEEADRLVIMHFLIKYAFNGNVVAPVIENLRTKLAENKKYKPKALDVGCGAGTWVLEMATEFPNSEFYGVDLRTMFPSTIKPKNTQFLQHDFLKNLPYPDESFEFVRMRSMLGFITQTQLQHLLSEIQRVLKPSGYIELLDAEYQIHRPGPICETILNQQLYTAMQEKNIDFSASHHLSTLLMTQRSNSGFVDVHQHRVTIPIGWGGQLGEIHAQSLSSFLKSIHPKMKQIINDGQFDDLVDKAITECISMQSHMNWFVCYGQKPATNLFMPTKLPQDACFKYPMTITPPFTSPNSSHIDLKLYYDSHECEINDFVDGYVD